MEKKMCEKCGINSFNKTTHNRKYCDICKQDYSPKRVSGIYKITNLINNKVYIGQSVDLKKRLSEHKRLLLKNEHGNEHLQSAYNLHGLHHFGFSIIEECEVEALTSRELYWINFYGSHKKEFGYNKNMPDTSVERFIFNEETKSKIGNANRKYVKDELVSFMQEFYYTEGRTPSQRDFANNIQYPSYNVYIDQFGSFKNALIESDLFDFVGNKKLYERKEYSKQDVYLKFKDFIKTHGRFPNHIELKDTKNNNLPSVSVVMRHYKSMENLKCEFNFDKESLKQKENADSLLKLKELYNIDGYITSRTIDKSDITRSTSFYTNRFGNLINAYILAGIPIEENVINNNTFKAV